MHNPALLLRDIRNMKKNNAIALSMTSKDIGSAKELKKARSSQQIINMKGFLENKNEKIKNIDQKLEYHQSEIEKNGQIIEQLSSNLVAIKNQLAAEREKLENEEKKTKQLRQQIERTNKLLKSKNMKIQQLSKKIQAGEKEAETLKPYQQKCQQLNKTNSQIRKQMNKLEENLNEKKSIISDQIKQVERYKQKVNELATFKSECERYKGCIKQKQIEIEHLNGQIKFLQKQTSSFRTKNDESIVKLQSEMRELSEKLRQKEAIIQESRNSEKRYKQKAERFESETKNLKSQIFGKDNISDVMKRQLKELKQKLDSFNATISKKEENQKNNANRLASMKVKLDEMQKKSELAQSEVAKLKNSQQKLEVITKKSKRLQELYKLMVPQIQCPYGHELSNPITVIPCGHNYCLGCKKGYTKDCMLCNGKLKIEAVYRNELMDDIINIVTGIKQILQMMK